MRKTTTKTQAKPQAKTEPKIQSVLILGSTGSIGTQALDVLRKHKNKFQIRTIVCKNNAGLIKKQAKTFGTKTNKIKCFVAPTTQILERLINDSKTDIIINAISGHAGLVPTILAVKSGKILLQANKESLVLEGKKIMELAKKYKTTVFPLDSEHHAIWRLLRAKNIAKFDPKKIAKITITCSGGPFFGYTKKRLAKTLADKNFLKKALAHPNWKMGKKILLESAFLVNKGYELIEAHHLFNIPLKNIAAVVDRKSYVHAIVEFKTKETRAPIVALAYNPDMRTVIEDALLSHYYTTNGRQFENKKLKFLTGPALKNYKFHKIDHKTFPAIKEILKAFKQNKIKTLYAKYEKQIGDFLKNN